MKPLLLTLLLASCARPVPTKPMVLEYSVGYPYATVHKHYDFIGTDRARAEVVEGTWNVVRLSETGEGWTIVARYQYPLEVIGIYDKE